MTLYRKGGMCGFFLKTGRRLSFLLDRILILATATATTIVLNFTLLFQFGSFLPGLKGEIDHALSGHGGVSWPATSTIYAKYFVAHFSNIGAACAVLLMVVGFNNLPRMVRASRAIF